MAASGEKETKATLGAAESKTWGGWRVEIRFSLYLQVFQCPPRTCQYVLRDYSMGVQVVHSGYG